MILRSLLIVATPYRDCSTLVWHHTRVWHDFSTRETWLTHQYVRHQRHMHTYIAEYRLFYRALLKKRPVILRSLLIVATPYSDTYIHNPTCNYPSICEACDMTRSSVWHDSFKWVTWLVQVSDMTSQHVGHDSFTREIQLTRQYQRRQRHIYTQPNTQLGHSRVIYSRSGEVKCSQRVPGQCLRYRREAGRWECTHVQG